MRVVVQIVIVVVLVGGAAGIAQWMIGQREEVVAAPVEAVLPVVEVLTARTESFQLSVVGRGQWRLRESGPGHRDGNPPGPFAAAGPF